MQGRRTRRREAGLPLASFPLCGTMGRAGEGVNPRKSARPQAAQDISRPTDGARESAGRERPHTKADGTRPRPRGIVQRIRRARARARSGKAYPCAGVAYVLRRYDGGGAACRTVAGRSPDGLSGGRPASPLPRPCRRSPSPVSSCLFVV